MKVFKTLCVFAAGATAGYFIAKNHVELNINIEPIVEKIKERLGVEFEHCCECGCDSELDDEFEEVADEPEAQNEEGN